MEKSETNTNESNYDQTKRIIKFSFVMIFSGITFLACCIPVILPAIYGRVMGAVQKSGKIGNRTIFTSKDFFWMSILSVAIGASLQASAFIYSMFSFNWAYKIALINIGAYLLFFLIGYLIRKKTKEFSPIKEMGNIE